MPCHHQIPVVQPLIQSGKSRWTGAVVCNVRIAASPIADTVSCLIQCNRPFISEMFLVDLAFRGHHSSGDIPVNGFIATTLYLPPGQCGSLFQKSMNTQLNIVIKPIFLKVVKIGRHAFLIFRCKALRSSGNWIGNVTFEENIRIKVNVQAAMVRDDTIIVL